MLRIAFAGTPQFAVPTLRALADSPHRLVGVLTQPDRPAGRGRRIQPSAVKALALELGLPLSQPERLTRAAEQADLASWAPDLLVVVAYGLLLPAALLALPPLGCVNVHASLLPRWRGAAPIQHALLAGDAETGVSIMLMDEGLDTGPVLAREALAIGAAATTLELQASLAALGAALLLRTLENIEAGCVAPAPQSERGASYAPKIDKRLAQIDWNLSALQIARQVRAFNPWPVAHSLWHGSQLRVWEAHVMDPRQEAGAVAAGPSTSAPMPGTLLGIHAGALSVQCGQGVLAITRVQLAGRRVIGASEFASAAAPVGGRLGT